MIYFIHSQGWYIGITAASQAVKAGSTPVPCSKKERHTVWCVSLFWIPLDIKMLGGSEFRLRKYFCGAKAFYGAKAPEPRRGGARLGLIQII